MRYKAPSVYEYEISLNRDTHDRLYATIPDSRVSSEESRDVCCDLKYLMTLEKVIII